MMSKKNSFFKHLKKERKTFFQIQPLVPRAATVAVVATVAAVAAVAAVSGKASGLTSTF